MNILITGSSGFYGNILFKYFSETGVNVYGVDLIINPFIPAARQINGNLRNYEFCDNIFPLIKFEVIIHLASLIDFAINKQHDLFTNNVEITKNLAIFAKLRQVSTFIFISSNSIFLGNKTEYIDESEKPIPIDQYGKSKLECENILKDYKDIFNVVIFRCPNIIDAGRMGMLTILYEVLKNNATLWMIGNGSIKHQIIYAQDLNDAILKSINKNKSNIFNIGSEGVESFKNTYNSLIESTGSYSKVRGVPTWFGIGILKILFFFGLSPMGPYQFRMLTRNFEFNIFYIKKELNWKPTKNLSQVLDIAYKDYSIGGKQYFGANGKPLNFGLLEILKYIKY